MHIVERELPFKCKECGSDSNHPSIDPESRLISTVCNECGHTAVTGQLPEPEPKYDRIEFDQCYKLPTHIEF